MALGLAELPTEVQELVYKHYYTPWSLNVHQLLLREEDSTNTAPNSSDDFPPSINILLSCKSIYRLARAFFENSYTGIIEVWIKDYLIHGQQLEKLRSQFHNILLRTHTLHLTICGLQGSDERDYRRDRVDLEQVLPNLEVIVAHDHFVCVNTEALLDSNTVFKNDANKPEDLIELPKFVVTCQDILQKRLDSTGQLWYIGDLIKNVAKLRTAEMSHHFRIENVVGAYETRLNLTSPSDEGPSWLPQVFPCSKTDSCQQCLEQPEELDYSKENSDLCLLM